MCSPSISVRLSLRLLPPFNRHDDSRSRSFLANVEDSTYYDLAELVSTCDLIFDFPALRETPCHRVM